MHLAREREASVIESQKFTKNKGHFLIKKEKKQNKTNEQNSPSIPLCGK